jgi:hypothetical protein
MLSLLPLIGWPWDRSTELVRRLSWLAERELHPKILIEIEEKIFAIFI